MGLVVALPLQPRSNAEMELATTVAPVKSSPAAAPSQKVAQAIGDTAAKATTGNIEMPNGAEPAAAGRLAERGAADPRTADAPTPGLPKAPLAGPVTGSTGAQPSAARVLSMRHKSSNKTKNVMNKTTESDTLS
jgi:hypothetical protein